MNSRDFHQKGWLKAAAATLAAMIIAALLTGCFGKAKPVQQPATDSPEATATESPLPSDDSDGRAEEEDGLPAEATITDIGGHPAEASIALLMSAGILTIDGEQFQPNETITRGEFLDWLIRADYRKAEPVQPSGSVFTDIKATDEQASLYEGYAANGWIKPAADGGLHLEQKLLREEVPDIWAAFFEVNYSLTSPSLLLPSVYLDVDETAAEYKKPMAHFVYFEAYQKAFGKTAYLRPKQPVTRAEAADWIVQAMELSSSLKESVFGGKEGHVSVTVQKGQPEGAAAESADDIAAHPFEADIQALIATVPQALKEGSFLPDEAITRGQFIDWMYRFDSKHMKPHRPAEQSFSDLASDHPLYETIEALKANGLINGFPDGTIRAEEPLTREQLTKLWVDYDSPWPFSFVSIIGYEDAGDIGKLYERTVSRYIAGGSDTLYNVVFTGGTKRIEPQKPVTRAQAAAWIIRGTAEEK